MKHQTKDLDEAPAEVDFSDGVRGKFAHLLSEDSRIVIRGPEGATVFPIGKRRFTMNAKEAAKEVLSQVSTDASFDTILNQIYVRKQVEEGLREAQAGQLASDEEVEAVFEEWRRK